MTIELLQTLSLVSLILAGILFVIAVMMFFMMDIKAVIGDVTGSTERKAINEIRKQNEESGDKAYKPSPVNASRGKLTDKITSSGKLQPATGRIEHSTGTEKLNTTELLFEANETMVLNNMVDETTILDTNVGETNVLDSNSVEFCIDMEISFMGSNELIE